MPSDVRQKCLSRSPARPYLDFFRLFSTDEKRRKKTKKDELKTKKDEMKTKKDEKRRKKTKKDEKRQ